MLRAGPSASTLTERRYKQPMRAVAFLFFAWLLACLAASPLLAQYAVPGTIEAENFSAMSGIQTGESSEGVVVGWLDAGDWMDYAINPSAAGTYKVDLRVASGYAGGAVRILSGDTELATVNVPDRRVGQLDHGFKLHQLGCGQPNSQDRSRFAWLELQLDDVQRPLLLLPVPLG